MFTLQVINDDVRNQGEVLASADVVVLNNVFCFFLPPQEQVSNFIFLFDVYVLLCASFFSLFHCRYHG